MRGDFSRVTFRPERHYSGVRLQQGRVQLDAEFNEHVDIDAHRHAETAADVVGPAGAPYDGGGFLIGIATGLRDVDLEGGSGWAVGTDALLLQSTGGGAWVLHTPPAGTGNLNALDLTGAQAGYAVGDGATILALTGSSWARETALTGVTANLFGVAAAADEAWAVGEGWTILHRSAGAWAAQSPPEETATTLRGVGFYDSEHGWAVGDGATILRTADGTTWERQDTPAGTGNLCAVAAVDTTHAWAVGDGGTILRWDGHGWTAQDAGVTGTLRAVVFTDASNGIAAGDGGTLLSTNDGGATWSPQQLPAGVQPTLWGLDVDADTAYAVGGDASLVRAPSQPWAAGPALPAGKGRSLTISAGDMHVGGARVVNEHPVSLTGQPDLTFTRSTDPGARLAFPPVDRPGTYGVYLEVFEDHVTALEREELREVALGGPDTATRTRTVWQARLLKLDDTPSCKALESSLPPPPQSDARMRARAEPGQAPEQECQVAVGGGYRRLENQLYRVEIHDPSGAEGGPTFTWSRDNGMVVARLEAVDTATASVTVSDPGPDEALGFGPGQWIELSDETMTLRGEPGVLLLVKTPRGSVLEIDPATLPSEPLTMAQFPVRPTVRRWDGRGDVNVGPWIELEDGVQVQFGGASFQTGDHWLIPARSVTGAVEWPQDAGLPLFQDPRGPRHRFTPLALVDLDGDGMWSNPRDCRRRFPVLTGLVQFFYVGGDGQQAMPDLGAPAPSYVRLDRPLRVGVSNWRWPVEGASVRFEVVDGGGRLNGTTEDAVTVATDVDGIAACDWYLNGVVSGPIVTQQVQATLLDEHGQPMQTRIVFNASLSVADEVAYDGAGCKNLLDQKTVQAAIRTLSTLTGIFPVSGTGIDIGPDGPAVLTVEVVVVSGCGPVSGANVQFTPAEASGLVSPSTAFTDGQGRATTSWTPDPASPRQQLTATLSDPGTGNVKHLPDEVVFAANLNLASDTAYTPACAVLAGAGTVQEAIDGLATLPRLFHVTGDGAHAAPGEDVDLEVGVASDCGPDSAGRVVQFLVHEGNGALEGTDPNGLVPTADGRAGCTYRMGTAMRHVVEARLIREGAEVYQPPVFFTLSRVAAVQVGYAPGCSLLKQANIDNVQDAITALCKAVEQGPHPPPSLTLLLQRDALNLVEDPGGRWLFMGGRVLDEGGNQIGHFASTLRTVLAGTDAQNTAMLTTTIFFQGSDPPENLTLQGAHSFNTGNQSGSVSTASPEFAPFIGRNFSSDQTIVRIG